MIRVMKQEAIDLKALGYNELCDHAYDLNNGKCRVVFNRNETNSNDLVSAPEVSAASMWLRDKYTFNVNKYGNNVDIIPVANSDIRSKTFNIGEMITGMIDIAKQIQLTIEPQEYKMEVWVNNKSKQVHLTLQYQPQEGATDWKFLGHSTFGNWEEVMSFYMGEICDFPFDNG